MDRAQRISAFWNWLPAFRVVAEHGSIHKAALVLHVSPSALSRTIRLLEEGVGATLFLRSASGLTLTKRGTELLKGTRDAMRRVDDALADGEDCPRGVSTWRAGACGTALTRLLTRALALPAGEPANAEGVHLRVMSVSEDQIEEELLRGNIDLVLVDALAVPESSNELVITALGNLHYALHAPPSWASRHGASAPAGSTDPFRERVVTLLGATLEGRGNVVGEAASLDSVELLAEHGGSLALLPTILAPAGFRALTGPTTTQSVVAVTRQALEGQPARWTEGLCAALRGLLS